MEFQYKIDDVGELLSPSLVVFRDCLESNLSTMIKIAGHAERLRPHCKTHKMPDLVKHEVSLGIKKHKCATIAEAEMLAECGVDDVFLAYNPVGPNIRRVIQLTQKYPNLDLKVTIDHPKSLADLADESSRSGVTIGGILDLNPGMNRTGIAFGQSAIDLYGQLAEADGMTPAGFHVYDGHHRQRDSDERMQAVRKIWDQTLELRLAVEGKGLNVPRIVAGGTGSFPCFASFDEPLLELSPGTVVFHDAGYRDNFHDLDFTPAALLFTRVISKPGENLITLDLGHKACAADPPAGQRLTFPDLPNAKEAHQSEEHLVLETEKASEFQPGDTLLAIPWHICPTSAVHQQAYVIEDGRLSDIWKVTARDRFLTV